MDKLTRKQALNSAKAMVEQLEHGCGNHGCIINPPKGMGTNAMCRCVPKEFADYFRALAERLEEYGRGKWEE